MKVSELAKELGVKPDDVLAALRALKLKAKGKDQELNAAVLRVVKNAMKKQAAKKKTAGTSKDTAAKKKAVKKTAKKDSTETETPSAKPSKKKEAGKTAEKSDTAQKIKTENKSRKESRDSKPNPVISDAPVITLKPLARKRKKTTGRDDSRTTEEDRSAERTGSESTAPAPHMFGTAAEIPQQDLTNLPEIEINVPISVKDLSTKLQQKSSAVLKELMQLGIFAHINQTLDEDIVKKVTNRFGYNLAKIKTKEESLIEKHLIEEENPDLLQVRAPVITFMGHVDHGKTTLIDKIRKAKVADKEHGGITQHMGAYSVIIPKGRITFLDTPGHEAFTAMRARGAHITDIVVLVVAADEGIMPQTKEAIDHARAANVPIVVALTKVDKKNADMDRVKKQLMEEGLTPEDWGGKTVVIGVSAITGEGIDQLLELILLESEMLELKANPDKRASGIVVEGHLSQGRGVVTTLIVQSGTLKEGDICVVGPYFGKVKAMHDDRNKVIKEAGPSMPVEVLGFPDVPDAGEVFYGVQTEREARDITMSRQEMLKTKKIQSQQKLSLEDIYSKIQEGAIKEVNVILKADVQGSLEALKDSLAKIPSDKVKLKFIHTGVGEVNLSDVLLAVASNAIILAFHVGVEQRAKAEKEKEMVDIREYRIIYDAVNDMKNALEGMLEAKLKKVFLARIEIRQVFKLSRSGIVAGCYVQKGKVNRKAKIDILRDNEVVYTGKISSLKRFKDDVREVNEGMECGITIDGFTDIKEGDLIEAFELESVAQTL